jgi:hypothetical protein
MKQRISGLAGTIALAATLLGGCGAQPDQSASSTSLSSAGRAAATSAAAANRPPTQSIRQMGVGRSGQASAQGSFSLPGWWRRAYAKMQAGAAAGSVERTLDQQPSAR